MSAPAWRPLWTGSLPADAPAVAFDPVPLALPAELAAAIAADWARRLAAARSAGVRLFDGPLAQLVGHARTPDGGLALRLGRTGYAHWLHSAGRRQELESRWGSGAASRPLALCAALICADGLVAIQRRSDAVAEGAGRLHVPGGHLDPDRHLRRGLPAPDLAMRAELAEELGLGDADLDGGRLLGLGEDPASGKPELLYAFATPLRSAELIPRAAVSRDRFETGILGFAPADPAGLSVWLDAEADRLTAPGAAVLARLVEAGPPPRAG